MLPIRIHMFTSIQAYLYIYYNTYTHKNTHSYTHTLYTYTCILYLFSNRKVSIASDKEIIINKLHPRHLSEKLHRIICKMIFIHSAMFNPELVHFVCNKNNFYFFTNINQWNFKFNKTSNLINQIRLLINQIIYVSGMLFT